MVISWRRIVYGLAVVVITLIIVSNLLRITSDGPALQHEEPKLSVLKVIHSMEDQSKHSAHNISSHIQTAVPVVKDTVVPIQMSSKLTNPTVGPKSSTSTASKKIVAKETIVQEPAIAGADDLHGVHKAGVIQKTKPDSFGFSPKLCDDKITQKLKEKLLNEDAITWCKWALNKDGGGAVVGKSWGRLKKEEQVKFEKWNCNNVNSGNNPSCNDKWGDDLVKKWRKHRVVPTNIRCLPKRSSNIHCYHNDNEEQFCVVENVKIDFTQYFVQKRPGLPDSKSFKQSYMSVDCNDQPPQSVASQKNKEPGFTFPHLFSTQFTTSKCDVTLNGTTLLYSHDNIRNLGHTINDIMNVWLMLWLDKQADQVSDLHLLSIDALKQYNNFGDKTSKFFLPYEKVFRDVLLGSQYEGKVLCLQRMLVQPHPSRGFIWEGWDRKAPCNEVGPSSLAQRFNLHSRHSFGVLPAEGNGSSSVAVSSELERTVKVLMIVRNEKHNDWGSYRSSRLFRNTDAIARGIEETLKQLRQTHPQLNFELKQQDMNQLSLEDQVRLVSSSSVMLGMHGAGIAMANYMSVGVPNCCGVLEIYPNGEFTSAQGHENMIRRQGISYKRIDVDAAHSHDNGADVPVDELKVKLHSLISSMIEKPSCVLPEVMQDIYLEAD